MRKIILCAVVAGSCFTATGQDWKVLADSAASLDRQEKPGALELYRKAKTSIPKDSVSTGTYGNILLNLGMQYFYLHQYDTALLYLETAKKTFLHSLGRESDLYIKAINSIASTLGNSYNLNNAYKGPSAVDYYLEGLELTKKMYGMQSKKYAIALNRLGTEYLNTDKYEQARVMLLEARRTEYGLNGTSELYLNTTNKLAVVHAELGQLENAEMYAQEMLHIDEKQYGKESAEYSESCNAVASILLKLGAFDKARDLYMQAITILQKYPKEEQNNMAAYYNNLGALNIQTGAYREADSILTLAKNITVNTGGYSYILRNLAKAKVKLRAYAQAETLYTELVALRKDMHGTRNIYYATACNDLGAVYLEEGKLASAEKQLLHGQEILKKTALPNHPYRIENMENIALLYWKQKKVAAAGDLFRKIFQLKYALIKDVFQFASETQKQTYINNVIGNADLYHSFYYKEFPKTRAGIPYDISFRSRNLILSAVEQMKHTILSGSDTNALRIWNRLSEGKKTVAALLKDNRNMDLIKKIEDSLETLEKSLVKLSGTYRKERASASHSWKAIRQHLQPHQAGIEFIEFNYRTPNKQTDSTYYAALILRKDQAEPVMVPLFEKQQLIRLLETTQNQTATENVAALYTRGLIADGIANGDSLYRLVWKPLEKNLKGISEIFFAPAGLLHKISFAALASKPDRVLSDQYRLVQLNTTESVLGLQPAYIRPSDRMQLYGGINYETDSTALRQVTAAYHAQGLPSASPSFVLDRGQTDRAWPYLKGTLDEVSYIKSAAGRKSNINLVTGIQATEENIKALDGPEAPTVLHIATHGFFFPDPKKTRDLSTSGNIFRQSDNPLLRSGLLFAGSNNSWRGNNVAGLEDGVLTAYEVSQMYLPHTKLVVLSACETALGDIQGSEGVYGLQRAFKMAGVQHLVMSLWRVDDQATAAFMQAFYQNLFRGKSISDSFYLAQSQMRSRFRNDPYKWAAWVLMQ